MPLLANQQRSPLLQDYNNAQLRRDCHHKVVRAMLQLLEAQSPRATTGTRSVVGGAVAIQDFLLYAVQASPALLPVLFGEIQFPSDMGSIFPLIARWNFSTKILLHGPSAMVSAMAVGAINGSSSHLRRHPDLLSCMLPTNLKKQHLPSRG